MARAYWGTILSVDDSVGRLYRFLEQAGELDNTLIVFTSDNGLLNGEHGMIDKRTAHEPSIRIPLVVRYPHGDGGPDRHKADLFHLPSDPDETRNLIDNPRFARKVAELDAHLQRLLKETGADPDEMPIDEGVKKELPDPKIR